MNKLLYILFFSCFFLSLKGMHPCEHNEHTQYLDSMRMLMVESESNLVITKTQKYLSLETTPSPDDCKTSLWVKYYLGLAQQESRAYEDGLTTLYDVILIAKKNNYPDIEAESYLTIALIYEFLGKMPKCFENLKKAEKLISKYDIKETYPRLCIRSSSYNRIVGNKQKAIEYAKKATVHAPLVSDFNNEVDGYMLLGSLEPNPSKKVEYFDKSVELSLKVNKYITAASQTMNSAAVLSNIHQYHLSNKYLNKAYNIIQKFEEKNKDYYSLLDYYHTQKKEHFIIKNQLDSALYHSEQYAFTNYQTFTKTNNKAIEQTENKFQVEIEKQKSEQVLKDAKMQRIALYIGSFFLLLLGGLVYMLFKNINKVKYKNQLILNQNSSLIEEKHRSDRFLSEIHHRVKNNLQNIISLILFKNLDAKTKNEKSLLNDINSKIMSLAVIYENLYSTGVFDKVNVKEYLEQFTSNYTVSTKNNIEIIADTKVKYLNMETMIPIGLLLSELCSNSESCCSQGTDKLLINITLNENSKSGLHLKYTQIGKIYPQDIVDQSNNSSNINIIKGMCRQLLGEHKFYNNENGCFELNFKEKVISDV